MSALKQDLAAAKQENEKLRDLLEWEQDTTRKLNAALDAERGKVDGLLSAVQITYRKHHLNDDSLGWDEVSDILHNTLCNVIGDEGYIKWIEQILKGGKGDE